MAGGASAPVNPDGTRGTGGPMGGWTVQHPSPPGEGFRSPILSDSVEQLRLYLRVGYSQAAIMVAMTKRVKTFHIIFTDPSKSFYCGGDKVSGRVEVNKVTRVSTVKVLGLGCAKVEYAKGKQLKYW